MVVGEIVNRVSRIRQDDDDTGVRCLFLVMYPKLE